MAYDNTESQSQLDDQQKNNQASGQGSNPITQLSGGGGFGGSGAAPGSESAAGQSASGQPTSSGSWTNLNQYLDANKDQAQTLGSQVAGSVSGQADQAKSDLGNMTQAFQDQAPFKDINSTTGDQVNSALQAGQYSTPGADTSTANKYLNNGWGLNSAASDITAFKPTGAPDWGTVQNEYQGAGNALQNTQTEAGRGVLLQNQFGKNGYTTGQQNFDQLLLQQNPNNQATLDSVYKQYSPGFSNPSGGMPSDLFSASQAAQQYAADTAVKGSGFQTQAQNSLTNQIGDLGKSVQNNQTQASQNYDQQYQSTNSQLLGDLNKGTLSPQEMQMLGVTGANPAWYGQDPEKYVSENSNPFAGAPGINASASAGDWANYSGLSKLLAGTNGAGQNANQSALSGIGLTGSQPINPTYSDPVKVDQGNLSAALQNAHSSYNQDLSGLIDRINHPTSRVYRDSSIDSGSTAFQAMNALNQSIDTAHSAFGPNADMSEMSGQVGALQQLMRKYGFDPTTGNSSYGRTSEQNEIVPKSITNPSKNI